MTQRAPRADAGRCDDARVQHVPGTALYVPTPSSDAGSSVFDTAAIVQSTPYRTTTSAREGGMRAPFTGRAAILAISLLGAIGGASAQTHVACVASAEEFAAALSALSTSTSDNDADDIRIRIGTYSAPAGGWVGTVSNHHDLSIRGGYADAACAGQRMDASLTVLDGGDLDGVLTINADAIPNSAIEVSGLTFQNGRGSSPFQSSAGGLKVGDPGPVAGGSVLIERNIFRHNIGVAGIGEAAVGGLLVATDGQPLIVRGNLFIDNESPNASAAYLFSNNAIDVANNTFAGNLSTDIQSAQRVVLDYFTFGGLRLDDNIFWDNSIAAGVADIDVSGQFRHAELRNNDIQSLVGTPVTSTGALSVSPGFSGDGNFRLSPTSLLIDAGAETQSGPSLVDLDGAQRVDDAAIDLGAYESNYIFVAGFE
jgi:hypothetical protein